MRLFLKYNLFGWALLSLLSFSAVGCVRESTGECDTGITVTLRLPTQADHADVTDAAIYVFDNQGALLEIRQTTPDKPERFKYSCLQPLYFAGWCNIAAGAVTVSQLSPGDPLAQGKVSLIHAAGQPDSIYNSPSDLFFGSATSSRTTGSQNIDVPTQRMVGAVTVTVRGMKTHTGFLDNDYSIEVGSTPRTIDFHGQYSDAGAGYMPVVQFSSSDDEFKTGKFIVMPSLQNTFFVNIYHAGTLIYTVSSDDGGVPFQVQANATLNVLITLSNPTSIQVRVIPQAWNEVVQWDKIFNGQ